MIRKGMTPEFGIENEQPGLFISSLEFTPSCETYEQKNHKGEVVGVALYGQKVEFTLEGDIPKGGKFAFGLGTKITLANELPSDAWLGGVAPLATTQIVTGCPIKMEREGARTASVSGVIYPFASGEADAESTQTA